MGTLGATAPEATAVAVNVAALGADGGVVNGPEDLPDWEAIDWGHHDERVQRLRQRIFKAAQAGDHKRVRNLQKLMLRSLSNTLVSVARVTERNTGRLTAGVDGLVAVTAQDRAELAMLLHRHGGPGHALPVRRVYIPKKGGKRPLGIPSIADRAQQQRVRNALEPEWEARLDPKQYGFRPGRGCHDAIEMIHTAVSAGNAKRSWVLDADLKSAAPPLAGRAWSRSARTVLPSRGLRAPCPLTGGSCRGRGAERADTYPTQPAGRDGIW